MQGSSPRLRVCIKLFRRVSGATESSCRDLEQLRARPEPRDEGGRLAPRREAILELESISLHYPVISLIHQAEGRRLAPRREAVLELESISLHYLVISLIHQAEGRRLAPRREAVWSGGGARDEALLHQPRLRGRVIHSDLK